MAASAKREDPARQTILSPTNQITKEKTALSNVKKQEINVTKEKWQMKEERQGEAKNPGPETQSDTDDEHQEDESECSSNSDRDSCDEECKNEEDTVDKDKITIISTNVHALGPRVAEIAGWKHEIKTLQETKMHAIAQRRVHGLMKEHGQQIKMSKPRKKKKGQRETGGVPIITGSNDPTTQADNCVDTEVVAEEGRYVETTICCGKGDESITVMSFCGQDGAASDGSKYRYNEDMMARVLLKAISAGNVPVFIGADLNINPEKSEVLQETFKSNSYMTCRRNSGWLNKLPIR